MQNSGLFSDFKMEELMIFYLYMRVCNDASWVKYRPYLFACFAPTIAEHTYKKKTHIGLPGSNEQEMKGGNLF